MNDKLFNAYFSLLIDKIEKLQADSSKWVQSWVNVNGLFPQNISGRNYNAGNAFFLLLLCEFYGFSLPIFMTFKQAKDLNLIINKGSKSFPITFYKVYYVNKETKKTKDFLYERFDNEADYDQKFTLKYYNVFNIDNTNYSEIYPEKYESFIQINKVQKPDENLICSPIESLLDANSWYCPIKLQQSNGAYYNFKNDFIVLPLKEQFKTNKGFYSTLLHEMAHSTGHESRLNRELKGKSERESYSKEELIAEITSVMTAFSLGFEVTPDENNQQYIGHWLKVLKEEPQFLTTLLSKINHASKMILERLGIESDQVAA